MSKAIPVSIWNNFTANMAKEALDRKSWILDGDLWFQFKVKWKYDFLKCQKLFLYLLEINSLLKARLQSKHGDYEYATIGSVEQLLMILADLRIFGVSCNVWPDSNWQHK